MNDGITFFMSFIFMSLDVPSAFINPHHHIMLFARISLTLFRDSSLSSITSGRSSKLHPVFVQSYCRYVLAGRPILASLCEGVHGRTLLMSSSLHLQHYPACLVRLIRMVFEVGGRWLYSCCFVGFCFQNLFNIARSILVQLPSSFFSLHLVNIQVVHSYSSMGTTTALIYFLGCP